jgi:osmoprotectant transport system ATP-binding protein
MLELRGVSKRYGSVEALAPLDLSVPEGRTVVLLGPSGCGKSTVLRLLTGLIAADSGEMLIGGERLTADSAQELRRRLGYVIQEGGLFPHLTARANACLLAAWLGRDEARLEARLRELCTLTHLDPELLGRYPRELSGGQRQRVALIRALLLDPEALLLDEPLGALDPLVRADLQVELREIIRELGKTVLLVTHDLSEAAWFADEVLLLRDGRVVQRGPFHELLENPADEFVERFVKAQRLGVDGAAS